MWKSFFFYTRSEQRGIILLIVFILIVVVARFTMPYWIVYAVSAEGEDDFSAEVRQLNVESSSLNNSEKSDSLFYFNPDNVTPDELTALGFSAFQQKSFLGYRNKVKKFSSKATLSKIYGMDSTLFARIEPFIVMEEDNKQERTIFTEVTSSPDEFEWVNFNYQESGFWKNNVASDSIRNLIETWIEHNYIIKSLPLNKIKQYKDDKLFRWLMDNSRTKFSNKASSTTAPLAMIELNTADTSQLCALVGIGSKLSLRIINFRNSLGGFYDKSQLADVYGISDELYTSIQGQLMVNNTLTKQLDIEKITLKEIMQHPYFNYNQAKELKNLYRKNPKPKSADILELKSITKEDWEKMKHYLKLSE